jgi:hypothetical protein
MISLKLYTFYSDNSERVRSAFVYFLPSFILFSFVPLFLFVTMVRSYIWPRRAVITERIIIQVFKSNE